MPVDARLLYPQTGPATPGGRPPGDGPPNDGPLSDGPLSDGPLSDGPDTDGPDTDGPDTDGGPAPGRFFAPLPADQVLALAGARRLARPDALLLLALMAHRRRPDAAEVRPGQRRLAAQTCCSVRTVQRGLARLEGAGLLERRRLRDRAGRLRGLCYDLSRTLALLPARPAPKYPARQGTTAGQWSPAQATALTPPRAPSPAPPTRQGRRPESESCTAEISNSAPAPAAALCPVVASLTSRGVVGPVAVSLVARYGEERCRRQVSALSGRRAKNPAALLVAAVRADWPAPPPVPPTPRPPSQHRYRPPAAAPPLAAAAPAALGGLDAATLLALERDARARLLAETPVLRASLLAGRSLPAVRARMRQMLAAGEGPCSGGGDTA